MNCTEYAYKYAPPSYVIRRDLVHINCVMRILSGRVVLVVRIFTELVIKNFLKYIHSFSTFLRLSLHS